VSSTIWLWIVVVVVVLLAIALVTGLTVARRRRISLTGAQGQAAKPRGGGYSTDSGIALAPGGEQDAPPHPAGERTEVDGQPGVGDDASVPRDAPRRTIVDVGLPEEDYGAALTAAAPGARVLILSGHPPERVASDLRALAVGSSGCAGGWPSRGRCSAKACSACSARVTSTRTRGRTSRTPC